MKKFIAFAFLFGVSISFAQGVDLPEFVIKGVKKVSLPKIEKSKPDFIPPLSESYFKYKFKPEDFNVTYVPPVDTIITHPFLRGESYSGRIKLGGGLQTLPVGEAFYSASNDNLFFSVGAKGKSIKDYEPYSNRITGEGNFELGYYTNHNAETLPLTSITLKGNGDYFDGKFWASENPALQRKGTRGALALNFYNFSPDKYAVALNLYGNYLRLHNENFTEQTLDALGFFKYRFSAVKLKFDGEYRKQSVLLPDYNKYQYFGGKFLSEIKIGENFFVDFGAVLAFAGSDRLIFPTFGFKFSFAKYFLLTAGISADAKYLTNYDLFKVNPYYSLNSFDYVFTREGSKVNIGLRFNYYNYIDAEINAYYGSLDGAMYFDDSARKGIFDVRTADDVTELGAQINLNLLYSKFGYFSAEADFRDIRQYNGNVLPYSPGIILKGAYNIVLPYNLMFTLGANYFSHYYADLQNKRKIEPYVNLTAGVKYKFAENFKLFAEGNNLLNKNNFLLPGYQGTPFDIILGVEYFWK